MAYSPDDYDLKTCMECPTANQMEPPCQRIQKYSDGSVVPIARDELGTLCPFAASWATVKALAQKYPNIGRMNNDGYYAIGQIRASMDLRKKAAGFPGQQLANDDPIWLRISPETSRSRMTWQDKGRYFYFLQAVGMTDSNRFQEWYKRSCIGPMPADSEGKVRVAFIRSWSYAGQGVTSQVQGMLSWESLTTMALSMGVIVASAMLPGIGWLRELRIAVQAFGVVPGVLRFDATLADIAQNIYNAHTRADLERAAQAWGSAWAQLATAGALFLFTKALAKGPEIWKQQLATNPILKQQLAANDGELFYKPVEYRVQMIEGGHKGVTDGAEPGLVWVAEKGGYLETKAGDIRVAEIPHMEDGVVNEDAFLKTLNHERVHSWLSPKLFLFRQQRAVLNDWGYDNLLVLRFVEEAMAETDSNFKANGYNLGQVWDGIKFAALSKKDGKLAYIWVTKWDAVPLAGTVLIGYIYLKGRSERWRVSGSK